MTTPREVALLRLAAQRLLGPGFDDAGTAVGEFLAMQAQDLRGALISVALRTREGTRAGGVAALDSGEIVRSWPMRGTLHLIRAADLRWVLDLTTERLIAGAARRREQHGFDDALIERARQLAVDALAGGRALLRAELLAVWETAGIATTAGRGYHLIWHLSQTGTLCFGPVAGEEQQLVLLDEWVPSPRRLGRPEALRELALRYFRSHGPASARDFAGWTKLVAADVRAGIAEARPELASLDVDGVEMLLDPATPERLAEHRSGAREVLLLPGFDELVLGYQDRSAVIDPQFAGRVVPGGNGVFQSTVVEDGRVVGTWRRTGSRTRPGIDPTPFTSFSARTERAIPRLFAALP